MLKELKEITPNQNQVQNDDDSDSEHDKVLVTNFTTGQREIVEVDKTPTCMQASRPCLSFICASVISATTTTVGIVLLFNPSTTLVTVGASLLSSNLSFWLSPPSIHDN